MSEETQVSMQDNFFAGNIMKMPAHANFEVVVVYLCETLVADQAGKCISQVLT